MLVCNTGSCETAHTFLKLSFRFQDCENPGLLRLTYLLGVSSAPSLDVPSLISEGDPWKSPRRAGGPLLPGLQDDRVTRRLIQKPSQGPDGRWAQATSCSFPGSRDGLPPSRVKQLAPLNKHPKARTSDAEAKKKNSARN